jgi:large subunit ribosomal protein L9
LKTLGLEKVRISLHAEVDATVIVNIARSSDEAEQQASLGRAVGVDESDLDEQDEDELDSLMAEVAPEAEAGAESAEDAPEAAAGDAEEAADDADPTAS